MITVVVVVHIIVAMVMIGLILLQKTEGNAAGGGFAANASLSGMMQPRARPNPLSRATVILGIAFFATSIGLALLAKATGPVPSLFTSPAASDASGPAPRVDDIRAPAAPASDAAPAVPGAASTPAPSFDAPGAAPVVPQSGAPQVPNN